MNKIHTLALALALGLTLHSLASVAAEPCPPEGKGGDPIANRLRNRNDVPASFTALDLPGFTKEFTPSLDAPPRRIQFDVRLREYMDAHERTGVALSGYLVAAKRAGLEPANCNEYLHRNIELWIGEIPEMHRSLRKEAKADGIIAELTPDAQDRHGTWRLAKLTKLARQGAKIRISGWPFYDAEHAVEFEKTRSTLWEIYPVTKIEIWKDNAWREL